MNDTIFFPLFFDSAAPYELAERYFDGTITEDECSLLLDSFDEHSDFQQAFTAQFNMHVLLDILWGNRPDSSRVECFSERLEFTGNTFSGNFSEKEYQAILKFLREYPLPPNPILRPVGNSFEKRSTIFSFHLTGKRIRTVVLTILAIIFLFWGTYGLYTELNRERRFQAVAHLTGIDRAEWEAEQPSCHLGDPIEHRSLRLKSGSISMKMLNGAEVVLEGPAELVFLNASKLRLQRGYLSTEVPMQNRTFQIETPQMTIDVLGTAFWVKATEDNSEVHLLRGRLKIGHTGNLSRLIDTGDAFSVSSSGRTQLFRSLDNQFVAPESLIARMEKLFRQREERLVQTLGSDPSLLVLLDFQRIGRTVDNLAVSGRKIIPSARVEGCTRVEGFHPNTPAIAFRRKTDRLALDIPVKTKSLTLACRLKIDRPISNRLPLLMSEEMTEGTLQWMIAKTGAPVLNVGLGEKKGFRNFAGPQFFTNDRFGKWVHLTVTLDARHRNVVWYVDGEIVDEKSFAKPLSIRIDKALIGNWSDKYDRLSATDGFALSEVAVYRRALSHEEVLKLAFPREMNGNP